MPLKAPHRYRKTRIQFEESNPIIVRALNKYILCDRCIWACAEITYWEIIDFNYRGFNTKVVTFGDMTLVESGCVYCGKCVAACFTSSTMTEKRLHD